jgi:hypothetical protein
MEGGQRAVHEAEVGMEPILSISVDRHWESEKGERIHAQDRLLRAFHERCRRSFAR